jgi:hypothetical protein
MVSAFRMLRPVEREPAATTRPRKGERDPRTIREEVPRQGISGRMWGAAVIPRLSSALKNELSEVKGFSERNIKRMLAFYREYPELGGVGLCHGRWHKRRGCHLCPPDSSQVRSAGGRGVRP